MRLLQSVIIGMLALPTIGTAMAQPPAAPAPTAPATGNPAKPVPLDEAVRGVIEMCTDHALGRPPYAQDKLQRMGFELFGPEPKIRPDRAYSVRAPTTEGVMVVGVLPAGSCMNNVNTGTFYHAFSAAFDSSTSYVRDTSGPTRPDTMWWRSQKVLAMTSLLPGRYLVGVVRISRALE